MVAVEDSIAGGDDGRPLFDPKLAAVLIGKHVLVGLTYVEHDGISLRREQLHGEVIECDRLCDDNDAAEQPADHLAWGLGRRSQRTFPGWLAPSAGLGTPARKRATPVPQKLVVLRHSGRPQRRLRGQPLEGDRCRIQVLWMSCDESCRTVRSRPTEMTLPPVHPRLISRQCGRGMQRARRPSGDRRGTAAALRTAGRARGRPG